MFRAIVMRESRAHSTFVVIINVDDHHLAKYDAQCMHLIDASPPIDMRLFDRSFMRLMTVQLVVVIMNVDDHHLAKYDPQCRRVIDASPLIAMHVFDR